MSHPQDLGELRKSMQVRPMDALALEVLYQCLYGVYVHVCGACVSWCVVHVCGACVSWCVVHV